MKSWPCFEKLLAIILIIAACTSAFGFDHYTLTDLGPAGTQVEEGLGINSSGWCVGSAGNSQALSQAIAWENGWSFLRGSGTFSVATGINDSASICGYWNDSSGGSHSYLYMPAGGYPLFPANALYARAFGLNAGNIVVGASANSIDFSDAVATMWTGSDGTAIPGVTGVSTAWGINASGDIVGQMTGLAGVQPFLYHNGVTTVLPLPGNSSGGAALAINDQGHAVGVAYEGSVGHPVLWRNGSAIDLGSVGNDGDGDEGLAQATGINNSDQIVGSIASGDYGDDAAAFIWQNGQISALEPLLVAAPNWAIIEARSINDAGQIIVTALDTGSGLVHACLLTPIVNLTGFTVTPSTVTAGGSAVGTVTINRPATNGGAIVALSSSDSAVAVPTNVVVPEGAITASFPITTSSVPIDKTVVLTASCGTVLTAALNVQTTNPHLDGFVFTPSSTYDGLTVTGLVSLRRPAPAGGIRITLTNTNPAVAAVPTSVTIPAGQRSKSFTTIGHAPLVSASTTATATFAGVSIEQTLNVHPIALDSLDFTVETVTGGATVSGVVRISARAPSGGYRVNLSSSNTSAGSVPATVTIPAGAQSAGFTVTTHPVPGTVFLTITATHGNSTLSGQLLVLPPEVSSFRLSTTQVKGGRDVTGTVTLTGRAATGGVTIHISANPNLAAPATDVVVRAGSTSVSFAIHTSTVTANTSVTLRAIAFNVMKTASLTLTP